METSVSSEELTGFFNGRVEWPRSIDTVYVMAYSVLTATYSITWNTLNLADILLSSQACIFY